MADPVKSPSGWWRAALVVSLSLNLLVIGLGVGAALNFRASGGPPRTFDISVGVLGRALAPEDRVAVAEAMQDMPGHRGPDRRELRAFMTGVAALLRQEPFDAAAFSAELDRQSDMLAEVQRAGKAVLVERIAAMTPEARAAFADRIETYMRRGPDEPRRD